MNMVKSELVKEEGNLSLSLVQVKSPALKLQLFTLFLQFHGAYFSSLQLAGNNFNLKDKKERKKNDG